MGELKAPKGPGWIFPNFKLEQVLNYFTTGKYYLPRPAVQKPAHRRTTSTSANTSYNSTTGKVASS